MKKKERDWKFIIGMVVLIAIFAVMGGAFWNMVGEQAQLVKEEEQQQVNNNKNGAEKRRMQFLQFILRPENF